MYLSFLQEASLYMFLLDVDRDLATEAARLPCQFCGAKLHSACYDRKLRGLPKGVEVGPEYKVRFSFCCSADGCRRRNAPPSVRFLGPKVYLGVLVALITTMRQGPPRRTVRELRKHFGVSRRTLSRWRKWWQEHFPTRRFWQKSKARFTPPVDEQCLPQSLVSRFQKGTLRDQIVDMLRFVAGLFSTF